VQDKPLTSENGALLRSSLGSSSLFEGAPEDAPSDVTPEAPREEDEIESNGNDTPSAEPRADLPQEREGGEEVFDGQKSSQRSPERLEAVRTFIGSLPGVNGQQTAAQPALEDGVAEALERGFTFDTLRAALIAHTDWAKARDPKVIPAWYVNAFPKIGDPPKSVTPLCDNPAHAHQPMPDPVDGGCLPCNTLATRGPITKTALEPGVKVDIDGDSTDAGAVLRAAIQKRRFGGDTRSRKQTPAQRMGDEADANRAKANQLLNGAGR
jgi:hypothetical protein